MTEPREINKAFGGIKMFSSSKSMKITAVFLLAVVLFLGAIMERSEAPTPTAAQCKMERRLGINACKPVLYGSRPPPECCQRIRITHVECVCPVITPQLAALVGDINRAITIIQGCGRVVPRHFKCGSITTP
ncbi:OLC1v1031569C1 [Oldenlandia corymbosa var. corymbosa]|uniref:OLC1v1031569C1 n=1 Tax=Oldenlandia corymbosa var. corymbosa TaxID=529605 RepID=A0AAV1CJP0_OLDCO|nr:OLC1v1031569C1 [Oldenlandia corymbosa var. corymbosa]